MSDSAWKTPYWPEGVVHTFTDYQFPIFKFLDDSAKAYPDSIFTQFNGASRTYAQVKDTADRIANFLSGRGIRKGDKVAIFLPNLPQPEDASALYPKYPGLPAKIKISGQAVRFTYHNATELPKT